MKIVFQSNSNNHGKGFSSTFISEDPVKAATKESDLDLSVHYTGIVIGVACAALLAALTIIAINHQKQSRRRRSSTMSSRRSRRSESFSGTDVVVQGAPPSYDIVMRCPELYPPSPQMTPVTSVGSSTPGRAMRFSALQQRASPLASTASSRYICNSSSDDSDTEDPPPAYPGVNATDLRKLQQQINQLANQAQNTDSQTVSSTDTSSVCTAVENCSDAGNQSLASIHHEDNDHLQGNQSLASIHHGDNNHLPGNQSLASIHHDDNDHLPGNQSLASIHHEDDDHLPGNQSLPSIHHEHDNHSPEILENEIPSSSSENPQSCEQLSSSYTADSQGQCLCDILDHNGRARVDTQSSIVGTVV